MSMLSIPAPHQALGTPGPTSGITSSTGDAGVSSMWDAEEIQAFANRLSAVGDDSLSDQSAGTIKQESIMAYTPSSRIRRGSLSLWGSPRARHRPPSLLRSATLHAQSTLGPPDPPSRSASGRSLSLTLHSPLELSTKDSSKHSATGSGTMGPGGTRDSSMSPGGGWRVNRVRRLSLMQAGMKMFLGAPPKGKDGYHFSQMITHPAFQVDDQDLQVSDAVLGKGADAVVKRGLFKGKPVAVKIFHQHPPTGTQKYESYMKEVLVYSNVQHPDLVLFLGGSLTRALFVSELMEGGTIEEYVEHLRMEGQLPAHKMVYSWTKGMFRALEYLHDEKLIIHRDLKPANILLSRDHMTAKVADFSVSKKVGGKGLARTMSKGKGSPRYMAYEMMDEHLNYDEKIDIYSGAMVMYCMITTVPPYDNIPSLQVLIQTAHKMQLRPDVHRIAWRGYVAMMEKGWKHSPYDRPTASDMLDLLDAAWEEEPDENKAPLKKSKCCAIM